MNTQTTIKECTPAYNLYGNSTYRTREGRIYAIKTFNQLARHYSKTRNKVAYKRVVREYTLRFLKPYIRVEICYYCGIPLSYKTIDIHHLRYGWPPTANDIVSTCHPCNVQEGEGRVIWMEA